MVIGLASSIFWNAPLAHAADTATNVELAKKVIQEVAPIVSEKHETDVTRAALTLEADDFIQKPLVVETANTVITPALRPTVRQEKDAVKAAKKVAKATGVHAFPYGYCTYFVAQKRTITWSGNAGTWLKGAKSAGLATGEAPAAGAIMVTSESSIGHVAYVEAVSGSQITISEMNYRGFGVVSTRVVDANSKFIKGYIY